MSENNDLKNKRKILFVKLTANEKNGKNSFNNNLNNNLINNNNNNKNNKDLRRKGSMEMSANKSKIMTTIITKPKPKPMSQLSPNVAKQTTSASGVGQALSHSPHPHNCHTLTRRAVKQALLQQQRRRRRNTNTNAFGLQSPQPKPSANSIPEPVVSAVSKSNEPVVNHKSVNNVVNGVNFQTALKQKDFVNDMKDETIRQNYISSVDSQVNKLLEAVKPKRSRGKAKSSQASQMAELREGRLDLCSPDSILVHTNLRALLNRHTFTSLPLYYQYKLVQLLPKFDQVVTPDGWIKPSSSALSNEFFAKSCQSWLERLSDSKLTVESIQRRRVDVEKEKSKLDPWKVKNFEPIWGLTLESQRDSNNEFERIPKSKPSNASHSQPESVRKNNLYSNKKFRSHRKVKPISKKSRIETNTNTDTNTNSSDNQIKAVLSENETNITIETTEQQMIVEDVIDGQNECEEIKAPEERESRVVVKKVRIQTEIEPLTPLSDGIIPKVHTVVLPSTPCAAQTAITTTTTASTTTTNTTSSSTSPKPLNKTEISAKDNENESNKAKRLTRKRNAPTNVNKEGVDEERSFLICRRALESSPNNKFFYVSRCRRIHTVDTPSNTPSNTTSNIASNSLNTTCSELQINKSGNLSEKSVSNVENSPKSPNSSPSVPSSDTVVSVSQRVVDNKSTTISTIQWAPSASANHSFTNELNSNSSIDIISNLKFRQTNDKCEQNSTFTPIELNTDSNSIKTIENKDKQTIEPQIGANNANTESEEVTIYNNSGDLTAFTSTIGISCDNRAVKQRTHSFSISDDEPTDRRPALPLGRTNLTAPVKADETKTKVIKVQLPSAVSDSRLESPKHLNDTQIPKPNNSMNSLKTTLTKVIPINTEALQRLKAVVASTASQEMSSSLTISPSTSVIVSSSQLLGASNVGLTPRIIAPKTSLSQVNPTQQTLYVPFSREVAVITAPQQHSHSSAEHLMPERRHSPHSTQTILRLPCKLPTGLTILPINEVPVITTSNSTQPPQSTPGPQPSPSSSVWILPVSSATETNLVRCESVANQSVPQVIGMPIAMTNNSNSSQSQSANHSSNNIINLCGETRLPSQITVIPIGSGGRDSSVDSDSMHGPCNLKPLIVCKKCGAHCHDDCIGPSKLCVECLVR